MPDLRTVHYSELTREEWEWLNSKGIVNGFWPASEPILGWLLDRIAPAFKRSNSNIHDFTYWQGGTEEDRLNNDRGFFLRLCEDSLDTGWAMPYYTALSLVYYGAVRTLGKPYFQYK